MIETYKDGLNIYAVDAEYIKRDTSFTRGKFQVKERKINEKISDNNKWLVHPHYMDLKTDRIVIGCSLNIAIIRYMMCIIWTSQI